MEEATHVGVQKQYEKSLRLTLNFPMNLKLLYKSSLKKKKEEENNSFFKDQQNMFFLIMNKYLFIAPM